MNVLEICPCGSGATYSSCCAIFLQGGTNPPTAEALMRSRYSAYVRGDLAYILASWHQSTRPATLNSKHIPLWQGLEVLRTEGGNEDDRDGIVEFKARFGEQTHQGVLHEVSRFVKEDGRWFYVDGDIIESHGTDLTKKIGRNAPCPCGSGKKYKKCCSP